MITEAQGVLNLKWIFAKIFGNNPSAANAYPSLAVPIIPDSSEPATEIYAPTPTRKPPNNAKATFEDKIPFDAAANGAVSSAS